MPINLPHKPYHVLLSKETLDLANSYKKLLSDDEKAIESIGVRLQIALLERWKSQYSQDFYSTQSSDNGRKEKPSNHRLLRWCVSRMPLSEFMGCLLELKSWYVSSGTLRYQEEGKGVGIPNVHNHMWTQKEIEILSGMSIMYPKVTIYDDGDHDSRKIQVHKPPFEGGLLFVPSASLNHEWSLDYQKVVNQDTGKIDQTQFTRLYEQRIWPALLYANHVAKQNGKKAFITMPDLGCGAFAGRFTRVRLCLANAVRTILLKYADKLTYVAALYYDPYLNIGEKDTDTQESIGGIDFIIRPSEDSRQPKKQLCRPRDYGNQYKDCAFFSIVEADPLSWPGNNYYFDQRRGDEAVKSSSTNVMALTTGQPGYYCSKKHQFLVQGGTTPWKKVVGKTVLHSKGRLFYSEGGELHDDIDDSPNGDIYDDNGFLKEQKDEVYQTNGVNVDTALPEMLDVESVRNDMNNSGVNEVNNDETKQEQDDIQEAKQASQRNNRDNRDNIDSLPHYEVLFSRETLDLIKQYKAKLTAKPNLAGTRLEAVLNGRRVQASKQHVTLKSFISSLTLSAFFECLLQSKQPRIFAESLNYQDNGVNVPSNVNIGKGLWNHDEFRILGDINMVYPNVTIYDDGEHRGDRVKVHEKSFQGGLLFVPGALLRNPESPDYKEVVNIQGKIDQDKFTRLYERRLLPSLLYANRRAKAAGGKRALITIPGIGCGVFAGQFSNNVRSCLGNALRTILSRHGDKLTHIAGLYYDPFKNTEPKNWPTHEEIHGVDFIINPLKANKNPRKQLCSPKQYGDKYKDCVFFSFVAWDHFSWPGNDYYDGVRSTDDGVKAAATNVMQLTTGKPGEYSKEKRRFMIKGDPLGTWRSIAKKTQLVSQGRTFVPDEKMGRLIPLSTLPQPVQGPLNEVNHGENLVPPLHPHDGSEREEKIQHSGSLSKTEIADPTRKKQQMTIFYRSSVIGVVTFTLLAWAISGLTDITLLGGIPALSALSSGPWIVATLDAAVVFVICTLLAVGVGWCLHMQSAKGARLPVVPPTVIVPPEQFAGDSPVPFQQKVIVPSSTQENTSGGKELANTEMQQDQI